MNAKRVFLYTCFFMSGASALIYEVVWQRMLTLVFGVSTLSVAAVLAAFLAGLAGGARLFAAGADRAPRPVRFYALIEVGIAVGGVGSVFLIPPLMAAYTALHHQLEPGWFLSNIIRFLLALAAFGAPALLIGATVPAMARLVSSWAGSVEVGFGRFYAVNTLGSVLGAAVAGFWCIPVLGVSRTLALAVGGNILAAITALSIATDPPADQTGAQVRPSVPALNAAPRARFVLWAAALTGAVGLGYEVVWIRLIAIYTLNSVYVFTMVVTVFLAALALGAALVSRYLDRGTARAWSILVVVQMAQAILTTLLLALVPLADALRIDRPGLPESGILLREYVLVALVVFVPTVLIGMTLPLLVALMDSPVQRAGGAVGRIYAWNAAGTIVGAALTGVALIPLIGIRGTLLLLAACNFLVATVAVAQGNGTRRTLLPPALATVLVFLMAVVPPAPRFCRQPDSSREIVLYYAEGPTATVHVSEVVHTQPIHRKLYVDSEPVAGTYPEIVTDQKMLAHVPLLLHADPDLALTVGFGTGGTSYSMLLHGTRVHCVEIEPMVPRAAGLFASENHGMVGLDQERPNFHLIINDARGWLHVAQDPYSVIVTDVTSIQYRGNGNLYTREYFQLMGRRLTPQGLACAWVPITGVTPEQLRILIRTFHSVYPHTSVWYMLNLPTDFVILVATPEPISMDLARIAERMRRPLVARDLAEMHLDNPYQFLACLLLAEADVAAYLGEGPVHTDDQPILDYLTHASRYQSTMHINLAELLAHRSDPGAYVSRWPEASYAGVPDGVEADGTPLAWRLWNQAAASIIAGHSKRTSDDPRYLPLAQAAYEDALRLLPEDPLIRNLNGL